MTSEKLIERQTGVQQIPKLYAAIAAVTNDNLQMKPYCNLLPRG